MTPQSKQSGGVQRLPAIEQPTSPAAPARCPSLPQFEVTIDWPSSWAAAGYTSLQLGFESRERAEAWHAAVAGVLQRMRDVK